MKPLLLLCDLTIAAVYGGYCYAAFPAQLGHILPVLLFFLAVRVLALALHDAISAGNLLLLIPLRAYQPALLAGMYVVYTALYFHLSLREQRQQALTRENTRLQIEAQQARSYRLLQERYEEQIAVSTRLGERQRIAQDIHDVLGHTVAASVYQLEAARTLLREQPERAERMVAQAADSLRHGMEQIREAVHNMRAETAGRGVQELTRIVDRFRRDSGIPAALTVEGGEHPLPPALWDALLANLNEALSNVLRHAKAGQVQVSLQVLPGIARLSVRDNGMGAPKLQYGMGLSGMRERAAALGGSLIVHAQPGMEVITLLPREGGGG